MKRLLVAMFALSLSACGLPAGSTTPWDQAHSAAQIFDAGLAALKSAHSFHIRTTQTTGSGSTSLEISLGGTGLAQGTVVTSAASADFIVANGSVYIRGHQFWVSIAGNNPNGVKFADFVDDHWVDISGASGLGQFSRLADPSFYPECLDPIHGTLTKRSRSIISGQQAIEVDDAADKPGSLPLKVFVAVDSPHYPLRVIQTGHQVAGGTLPADCTAGGPSTTNTANADLDQFNRHFAIKAPSDALNFSALTH